MRHTIIMHVLMLMAVFAIVGCAAMNPLSALMPDKPSIELNANVGKNVKQEKAAVKIETGKTEQTAETISNDTKYEAKTISQITNQMPMWMFAVVILLAGWAIPTPRECMLGLKSFVNSSAGVVGNILVTPCKGVANFILLLCGKEKL